MRRWVWKVLLMVLVMAALSGTAMAANVIKQGGFEFTEQADGSLILSKYTANASTVAIPDNVDGKAVVAIGPNVFSGKGLTTVTIPDTVKSIGEKAFANSGLTRVEIPGNVKTIGDSAFESCSKLTSVTFKDNEETGAGGTKTTIGIKAFAFCGITTLNLSGGVGTIEDSAFMGCKMSTVIIWEGTTAVKKDAFSLCDNLSSVAIAESVTTIEAGAFVKNEKLKVIHYAGTNFPDNTWAEDDIHPAIVENSIIAASCEGKGVSNKVARCKTDTKCLSYNKSDDIAELGHDLVRTEVSDGKTHADCETWTKTFTVTCSRADDCGYIPTTTTETVQGDSSKHQWGDKEEDPERTQQPDECRWPGIRYFYKECSACHEKELLSETEEIAAAVHKYEDSNTPRTVVPSTCSRKGITVVDRVCKVCGAEEKNECEDCEKMQKEGIEKFIEHLKDEHNGQELDLLDHTWGKPKDVVTTEPDCENETDGVLTIGAKVCSVCKEVDTTDCKTEEIKWAHTPDKEKEIKEETTKEATCTEKGERKITATCKVCGKVFTTTEEIEMLPHTPDKPTESVKQATCTEQGEKVIPPQKCTKCGEVLSEGETVKTPPLGHSWGPFQEGTPPSNSGSGATTTPTTPGEGGTSGDNTGENTGSGGAGNGTTGVSLQADGDSENAGTSGGNGASCGEETEIHGYVECSRCHEILARTITVPATGKHTWGEWKPVKPATATADGYQERTCSVCGKKETGVLPATGSGSSGSGTTNPGTSNPGTSNPGTTTPTTPTSYTITIISASNGAVTSSAYTAQQGTRVTLTAQPASGYELDWMRVTTSSGSIVTLDGVGGGVYRFTMPSSNVEVRFTFTQTYTPSWATSTSSTGAVSRWTEPSQTVIQGVPRAGATSQMFSDIPVTHWAAGEINWASNMGYMNGSGGRFNPNGTITFQQMWMVLARISGSRPANMADARNWAVLNGFAEGGNPTHTVARHQLVTALYRTAHIMGSTNHLTASLAGYPDSRTVPTVARAPMAWSVANGILGGNANGRLDPFGTVTRAQFAVILYRFSQRI